MPGRAAPRVAALAQVPAICVGSIQRCSLFRLLPEVTHGQAGMRGEREKRGCKMRALLMTEALKIKKAPLRRSRGPVLGV